MGHGSDRHLAIDAGRIFRWWVPVQGIVRSDDVIGALIFLGGPADFGDGGASLKEMEDLVAICAISPPRLSARSTGRLHCSESFLTI